MASPLKDTTIISQKVKSEKYLVTKDRICEDWLWRNCCRMIFSYFKKSSKRFKKNKDLLFSLFILIKEQKKWWLLPLLLILFFLGLFISLTGNQSILPAIYALF